MGKRGRGFTSPTKRVTWGLTAPEEASLRRLMVRGTQPHGRSRSSPGGPKRSACPLPPSLSARPPAHAPPSPLAPPLGPAPTRPASRPTLPLGPAPRPALLVNPASRPTPPPLAPPPGPAPPPLSPASCPTPRPPSRPASCPRPHPPSRPARSHAPERELLGHLRGVLQLLREGLQVAAAVPLVKEVLAGGREEQVAGRPRPCVNPSHGGLAEKLPLDTGTRGPTRPPAPTGAVP